jgi:excisionase family DNA binding protein
MEVRLLSVPAVAALLQRSESCIRRLIRERIIPSVRIGRAVLVDEKQLDDWLKNGGDGGWRFHAAKPHSETRSNKGLVQERSSGDER